MSEVRLDVIVSSGGKWFVYSEDRKKRLGGPYGTRAQAVKRLAQVEYWKHRQARFDQTPADARKRVAHEVALHRMWGQKRRRRKVLPRQIPPKSIAVDYAKALKAMFRSALAAYQPVIDLLTRGPVRTDADSPKVKVPAREARRLLGEAQSRLESSVSTAQVETLASKFATRTSSYQRLQLGRQVRAALGAEPYMRDSPLAGAAEDFIAYNVSLIKRIPTRLHEKIEGLVMNSVGKSELNVNLADEVKKQFGVAERHAVLIARDQISKYYGAVNMARQQELGVTKFIWRTANDERVRDTHEELDGETFSWDDLPTDEKGEEIYPGSPINCRCFSEPVMDDVLDDVKEAETAMEPPDFESEVPDVEEIDTEEE